MASSIDRKKFIQLAMLTNLGLLARPLWSVAENIVDLKKVPFSNANVTYYKAGEAMYETLRKGFNKRIDKLPQVIALCNNTNGVVEAIKVAAKNNWPVAIKSGGHCMEGFSCNDGGMVINLSAMKSIEWLNNDSIKVAPGCTLAALYEELLPKNKILPGGSCAEVGIGGLVLGGGYGLLARRFGLTCDSLQAVKMVDGKGTIISSATDADLLWACKGGNNGNFGVVTELTFKVHNAPAYMQSHRFKAFKVTAEKSKAILKQWFALTATLPTGCFSAFVQNGKTLYILLTNISRHTPDVQKVVEALSALTQKTTRTPPQPLAKALQTYYGIRHPLYFKNASAGLYKNFEEIEQYIDKVLDVVVNTPGMIYQVNMLGGNIQNEAFEKAAAFPHRAYTYFSELQTYWEQQSQQSRLLLKFQQVQQIFADNKIAAQYRNYPDINFSNSQQLYYGKNEARLQQLKATYDPANIFRYEQSIKPV